MSASEDPGRPDPAAGEARAFGAPPGRGTPPAYGTPPGYGTSPDFGTRPERSVPPGGSPYGGFPYGGYGPIPGYGGTPGYPRPTNTMAILSLVLAFVVPIAGLVLGIVARRQIARTGEEGGGLALAGIVIGAIATALVVLGVVLYVALLATLVNGSFGP